MSGLARLFGLLAVLIAILATALPAEAQITRSWVPGGGQTEGGPDYEAWEAAASLAEQAIANPEISNLELEQTRARVVEWRARFLEAQSTNQARIETLRGQIAALGPPPEEGVTEAPEIANRRVELNELLARLQAPVVAADEAFRRADGLVREIDRILRERQADELLRLWPAPINPANWPEALRELQRSVTVVGAEIAESARQPAGREALIGSLPLVIAYLLGGLLLILRGRRMAERLATRMQLRAEGRGEAILALVVSLGQVVVPYLGVLALVQAIRATGLVGMRTMPLVDALPFAGLTFLLAMWLGGQIFPRRVKSDDDLILQLPDERRREGRFHAGSLGLVLALGQLLEAHFISIAVSDAAVAVLSYPLLFLGGLLVFRIGQLLRKHVRAETEGDTPAAFASRLFGLVGTLAMAIGVLGPLLGAVGYVSAALALVTPAAVSLGLIGLLLLIQRLLAEGYALLMGGDVAQRDALLPTLAGLTLVLVSVPVFLLVWGVRPSELEDMWITLQQGFTIGDTRISPTQFLTFVLVFVVGFALTRLVQGALKSSVLPKTKLDKGAQSAVVYGLGYVGIFIAALFAFSTAGIDLSNLAIVAGALSVGIGFGMQNIVNNFVSGIILLFERPIAEGDWIEVGGVMGTVRKISVRSTVIQTFDRNDVIVPNADLISNQVTNWTRYNLTGRLIVPVSVAYGTDTRKVERVLMEVAEAQPLVVLNPPPTVVFNGFGADGLEFDVRVILRDVNFMLRVRSDMNHEIARRFGEEGIEIPFAQRDIWLRNPEALTAALRPAGTGNGAATAEPDRAAGA